MQDDNCKLLTSFRILRIILVNSVPLSVYCVVWRLLKKGLYLPKSQIIRDIFYRIVNA